MRVAFWLYASIGLANATALSARDVQDSALEQKESNDPEDYPEEPEDYHKDGHWRPKSSKPQFFSLKVDDKCTGNEVEADCPFDGYAIRLVDGILIATPFNKWWDPPLPVLFVDDDSKVYTVSKKPMEIYVNSVTGAVKYAPVGWLPPNSIANSFYKIGSNPLGKVDPSPAYFAWPTAEGRPKPFASTWWLCPLGATGQYQVYASNFDSKQGAGCKQMSLAAINANPWH